MTSHEDSDQAEPTQRLARRHGTVVDIQALTVAVVEGPDAGQVVTVEGRSLKIGKGPECDLRLTDTAVSRYHAVISPTAGGLQIEDLGSTNGTEVNGVLVKTAVLVPGCRIVLGNTTLEVSTGVRKLLALPSSASRLEGMVGATPVMRAVYGLVRQVAPTEVTVVIGGETGSGKEVVARVIHQLSRRRDGPFVVFDCANVNRDLLGSELFGHQKGAFTGAVATHRGAFDRAHGGTLLLDEIGELPLDLQSRLLGVLQRREVQPLGAEAAHPVDVRVLAATHRDLEALSRSGGFREDLYFRLAVITIELPPLRERLEDISLLVEHFLADLAPTGTQPMKVSPEALAALKEQPWRGNIRELANTVQRAFVMAGDGEIQVAHLGFSRRTTARSAAAADLTTIPSGAPPPPPAAPVQAIPVPAPSAGETLEAAERRLILEALQRHQGNKSRAARELGIALSTLRRKLNEFGLGGDSDDAE